MKISRMVSFQLLLNSQQGPHFRTNSKTFLHTARLNSVNECFKFNDGCIDWEIDIMKRRFRTERVDFYFWLLDGKPINKWHTFSLGGLHLQDHREAWLSFSQLVELQLQHHLESFARSIFYSVVYKRCFLAAFLSQNNLQNFVHP